MKTFVWFSLFLSFWACSGSQTKDDADGKKTIVYIGPGLYEWKDPKAQEALETRARQLANDIVAKDVDGIIGFIKRGIIIEPDGFVTREQMREALRDPENGWYAVFFDTKKLRENFPRQGVATPNIGEDICIRDIFLDAGSYTLDSSLSYDETLHGFYGSVEYKWPEGKKYNFCNPVYFYWDQEQGQWYLDKALEIRNCF